MTRISAAALIEGLVDARSFQPWSGSAEVAPPDPDYQEELVRARTATGLDEAVITGEATIAGSRVALVACEFGFLAGSVGVATAERITRAIEQATVAGLPLIASPASGGMRMQEGTAAFLQMVKITAAIAAHKAASLPYLVYLRHPTTGGVLASWGSLGHLTAAEPGALIGSLGPRVFQSLHDRAFPADVQTAENLAAHGIIDAVVPVREFRDVARRWLMVWSTRAGSGAPAAEPATAGPGPENQPATSAWASIGRSRDPRRPGLRELLAHGATDVTYLNGTGAGEADGGLLIGLCRFGARGCVVFGHDRRHPAPVGPAGLRAARRGIRLAAELGLPLVTVIDTGGAALSPAAEEGALAGEIARCLADLVTLASPTIAVLLGQGSGGAALAFVAADRVIAAEHAWLSPISPEGAAAIVYGTVDRAPDLARRQRVSSGWLAADGIVDLVIAEHPDAADEPAEFSCRIGAAVTAELARSAICPPAERLSRRQSRYRQLGIASVA